MRPSLSLCVVLGLFMLSCKSREEHVLEEATAAGRAAKSAFDLKYDFSKFDEKLVHPNVKKSRVRLRELYAGFVRDTWAATEKQVMVYAELGKTSDTDEVGSFILKLSDAELAARWNELAARAELAAKPVREQKRDAQAATFSDVVMVTGDSLEKIDCLAPAFATVSKARLVLEQQVPADVRHVLVGELRVTMTLTTRQETRQREVQGRKTAAKVVVAAAMGDVEVSVADSVSGTVTFEPKNGTPQTWEAEVPFNQTMFNDARQRIDIAKALAWPALCDRLAAAIAH